MIVMEYSIEDQRVGTMSLVAPHGIDAEENHMAFAEFAVNYCRSTGQLSATS